MLSSCSSSASSRSSCPKPKKRSERRSDDESAPCSRARPLAPHPLLSPEEARQGLAAQMPDRRSAQNTSVIRLASARHTSHHEPQEGEASDEYLRHQGIPSKGPEMAQNHDYQGHLSESADDHLSAV